MVWVLLPALHAVGLIGRAGNHRAVASGIRVLPRHCRTGSTALERLHLRRIGALLVLVIHAGANAVADHSADRCAGEAGGDALAGSAAELRSDQAAGYRADDRAGVL